MGFKNSTELFAQPETLPILYNAAIFVVGSIAGQFLIGSGLALFFWVNFPGASWLRGLFLVSWVMPGPFRISSRNAFRKRLLLSMAANSR